MQKFKITLQNKRIKGYYLFAWLIAFIIYASEVYIVIADETKIGERFWVIGIAGICLIWLILDRGFNIRRWLNIEYVGTAYAFLILPLYKWKFFWFVGGIFLFMILLSITSRKLTVIFTKTKIIYPSLPEKEIAWNDLANCLLKDRLLTIDFKNNKLIQVEIEEDDLFNEKEFNDFCNRQLVAISQQQTT